MAYEPAAEVSTVPEDATARAPSKLSMHVAPASAYVAPTVTVAGFSPVMVMAGGVVSWTVMILDSDALLPAESAQE